MSSGSLIDFSQIDRCMAVIQSVRPFIIREQYTIKKRKGGSQGIRVIPTIRAQVRKYSDQGFSSTI